ARQVQRKAPGNNRQSRLRAYLPRAHEHARMDADFPGTVVALRDLLERPNRSGAWARLDRGPRLVFRWLQPGRGEAVAWLLHPVDGVLTAVHRCGRRCCHASVTQLKAPQPWCSARYSGLFQEADRNDPRVFEDKPGRDKSWSASHGAWRAVRPRPPRC